MARHSHWAQIKRSKSKVDAQRGRLFSRLAKDIIVAARHGGGNPDGNLRLKIALQAAKTANMPADTIQRAIAKGTGESGEGRYEQIVYEGYGPGGVAVLMDILTDNRNRTAADVRTIFSRHGGNLGEAGSVAWIFNKTGVVAVPRSADGPTEDDVLAAVLEAGAEDVRDEDEEFTVHCAPDDVDGVAAALASAAIPVARAETDMVPTTTVVAAGETAEKLLKLLDALDDNDDVQNVYANFELAEDDLAALEE